MPPTHTPGPWSVYQPQYNHSLLILPEAAAPEDFPHESIAILPGVGSTPKDTQAANAALIAAAPRMLSLLAELETQGNSGVAIINASTMALLRDAIRTAQGG